MILTKLETSLAGGLVLIMQHIFGPFYNIHNITVFSYLFFCHIHLFDGNTHVL
jgi:hypothetical protein